MRHAALLFIPGLLLLAHGDSSEKFRSTNLPVDQRVSDLVGRMTLAEKVSQMQNQAAAIPRLGIPAYNWWNEGLHGVARSGYATVFPQAIGLAATWDTALIHQVATAISTEARAKYNQAVRDHLHSIYFGLTFWSPNINIFRDPRWGRGQETYGEDPFLTGRLAIAFITGLQGDDPRYLKTIATPKHFAVHSGPESERHRFNVKPSPADLADTYLPAFRAAITEGHADSVMCAYNALDGVPACGSSQLLETDLRHDWHFQGYVTSDCGAVSDFYSPAGHHYSADRAHAAAAAVKAGTDTSCGDEYGALVDAVNNKLIDEAAIDTAVKRLFTARFRLGQFDPPGQNPYDKIPFTENNSAEHRALALEVARKSMVLLKNQDALLPLGQAVKTIAVIGPNAASLAALEGNYNGVPSDPVLPIDGVEKEFKARAKILYAQAAPYADGVPLPVPRSALKPAEANRGTGLRAQYYSNSSFQGKPVLTRIDPQIDFDWNAASPTPGIPANDFSVRWTGTFTPPKLGDYEFNISFASCYPCSDREHYTAYLDGRAVASLTTDESKPFHNSANPPFHFHFADTQPHALRIDYSHHSPLFGAGLTLNWLPPKGSLLPDAVAATKQADVVLAFLGLSPQLEGEEMPVHVEGFAGGDRTKIELPDAQEELLRTVGATGKPVIVILMNGSALAINWGQQHAAAVLEAWYPGEAGGQAIAETLSGRSNPGGRLPITFYSSTDQLPPFTDYSMRNRTYRFFTGEPLYQFGDGLSYSTFAYSALRLSKQTANAGDALTVEADVKNVSQRPGDEVVQLYLTPPRAEGTPLRELRGFARVPLSPGQTRHVRFPLSPRDLSEVSRDGSRSVQPGSYGVKFGTLSARFTITGSKTLPN